VRAEVENDHTTVDFLRFGGGTGVLTVEWEQRWIRCRESECAVVWSAPLLWTQRVASLTVDREYAVAQTERPDRETIRLTMRRLGLVDPLTQEVDDAPVGTARRVVGPDTVETYHWDSSVYTLAARRQVVPGVVIAGEFDLLTQETVDLIHRALSKMFQQSDGSFDDAGLWVAEAEFWGGVPSPEGPEDLIWGDVVSRTARGRAQQEAVSCSERFAARRKDCSPIGRRGRPALSSYGTVLRLRWY